jgi:predicted acetyltransferase
MIRKGKHTDKETLMRMWKTCFPLDPEPFIRFYFDKVYANDETLVYVANNEPVASLQMIPYRIKTGNRFLQGGYISGAMTHPGYRKKGYMERLLTAAFDCMQKKEYACAFLIPQEKHLVDYYEKFGFESAFPNYSEYSCPAEPKRSGNVNVYAAFSAVDVPALYFVYSQYLMKKENVVLKSESQFSNILWDFFAGKGLLFANDEGQAYAFKKENTIILTEFFYRNEEVKFEFLQTIGAYYSVRKTIICNDPSAPVSGCKGMIKSLSESVTIPTGIYLSRMLE